MSVYNLQTYSRHPFPTASSFSLEGIMGCEPPSLAWTLFFFIYYFIRVCVSQYNYCFTNNITIID